jgi:hypothetical protein
VLNGKKSFGAMVATTPGPKAQQRHPTYRHGLYLPTFPQKMDSIQNIYCSNWRRSTYAEIRGVMDKAEVPRQAILSMRWVGEHLEILTMPPYSDFLKKALEEFGMRINPTFNPERLRSAEGRTRKKNRGSVVHFWRVKNWREMQKDVVWMQSLYTVMRNMRTQFAWRTQSYSIHTRATR